MAGVGLEQLVRARDDGTPVYSADGGKLGRVEAIFLDDQTEAPEWVAVGTGLLRTKRVLVPVHGADLTADGLRVPYAQQQVKDAPDADSEHIPPELEERLYAHYGLGHPGTPSDDEVTVTRSEERVRVGTEQVETGRVRLRKWVETEPVETSVRAGRESARIEHVPVEAPVTGVELRDQEIEVSLRAQEPTVEKQVVATERLRVGKDVETEHGRVRDEVRKERVDVDVDDESLER